jgi:predicted transcriptional regulator
VILLRDPSDEVEPWYHEDAVATLRDEIRTVETEECAIFEMYPAIGKIGECITAHQPDDDVYVNLATGSKITAIAGMIASMTVGATPYYVKANNYGDPDEEPPPETPVASDAGDAMQLPQYHIDAPSSEAVAIMDYLAQSASDVNKQELIQFALDADLSFMQSHANSKAQAQYRALETVLEPLLERGYIEIEAEGRNTLVSLTDHGKNTYRAFRYQLEEELQ